MGAVLSRQAQGFGQALTPDEPAASDMRRALMRGELALHYQPQVELATGRMAGVEALVRWEHPKLGLLGPASFISLAERTGLITFLGRFALRRACRDAREWQDKGAGRIAVAVNVSVHQMHGPGLQADVVAALEESGLDPSLLEVELTESLPVHDLEGARQRLEALRAMGVRTAMDDFGTGFSSLQLLTQLPLDRVKIDRAFIERLDGAPDGPGVVLAILAMARSLGLEVVAEGVERPEQLAFLAKHGCDVVQGYLLSAPLRADEVVGWARSSTPKSAGAWRRRQGLTQIAGRPRAAAPAGVATTARRARRRHSTAARFAIGTVAAAVTVLAGLAVTGRIAEDARTVLNVVTTGARRPPASSTTTTSAPHGLGGSVKSTPTTTPPAPEGAGQGSATPALQLAPAEGAVRTAGAGGANNPAPPQQQGPTGGANKPAPPQQQGPSGGANKPAPPQQQGPSGGPNKPAPPKGQGQPGQAKQNGSPKNQGGAPKNKPGGAPKKQDGAPKKQDGAPKGHDG